MDRTVVLITGCSSGIGLHLAVRLASDPSRSFKVYATMRDLAAQGQLREAARSRGCPPDALETLQLDVRDANSVAAARARVSEGRVDVLGEPRRVQTPTPDPEPRERAVSEAGASPRSVQRGPGPARAAGGADGERRERGAGRERGRDAAGAAGLPAGHEAAPRGAHRGDRQHGRLDGDALQRRLLCQQVRARRPVREPRSSAAALRHPRQPGGVRPGAHRLSGEAGGRPRRGAGARRRRDPRALLPLPVPLGGRLPRGGAGPGGGGRAFPHSPARPAAGAALLQHRALPAAVAPARGRPQRPRLRRRHAPGCVLPPARRPPGWRPRESRSQITPNPRCPAIKPQSAVPLVLAFEGGEGEVGTEAAGGAALRLQPWGDQRSQPLSLPGSHLPSLRSGMTAPRPLDT
ncbi:17-beta-hydroxysteroid dehydrogenase type 1 isoform X2 [Erinaceus europaeus]|uniref:17-beta-hydroxysteroid dehydrogenase type 1 isoform X2 n=1 Tax=Erinaceus europaeus TaxID=9365 RepID=A0ABM3YEF3_ERIEU|nr:17-beta-hydroxysteroid dehydrogenase type 1 isoform X2 [Erinaceus europaeus]